MPPSAEAANLGREALKKAGTEAQATVSGTVGGESKDQMRSWGCLWMTGY